MITDVELFASDTDQHIKVSRNWEGDEKNTVMVTFSDDDEDSKPFTLYASVGELEGLVKAAKVILEDVRGDKGL